MGFEVWDTCPIKGRVQKGRQERQGQGRGRQKNKLIGDNLLSGSVSLDIFPELSLDWAIVWSTVQPVQAIVCSMVFCKFAAGERTELSGRPKTLLSIFVRE